jgi:hypothetical protein
MAPKQQPLIGHQDVEGPQDPAVSAHHTGNRRGRVKRRGFKLQRGTGWSFVLGLLLGLAAASFVSRLFVNP